MTFQSIEFAGSKLKREIFANKNANWGRESLWVWNDFFCHWRETGYENKKSILFLHGFGASSSHWRYNANYFAKRGFRVYALDLLGFGKSDQPGTNQIRKLDNELWARQVAAFIKEIIWIQAKNEKTILIGNSLGALVALTTAAFYPELVESVVAAPLPDPALIQNQKNQSEWLISTKNFIIKILFKLLPLELIISLIIRTNLINIAIQSAYNCSIKKDKELKKIIIKPAQRKSAARALRAMCIGMATRRNEVTAPFLLKRINAFQNKLPILLLWGRQDKFVPLKIGKELKKQYQWLSLSVFDDIGHCPHDEAPSTFNKSVLNWLRSY